MVTNNTRIYFNKKFQPESRFYLIDYSLALDKFIYDFGGCIVGDRDSDITNPFLLTFTCTIQNRHAASDLPYFYGWLEKMKSSHKITIVDNIEVSGELFVTVE